MHSVVDVSNPAGAGRVEVVRSVERFRFATQQWVVAGGSEKLLRPIRHNQG